MILDIHQTSTLHFSWGPSTKSQWMTGGVPKQKAEELNSQFNTAFSGGETFADSEFSEKCSMPDDQSDHRPMAAISVSTQGVEKLLSNLNPTKAAGPDGIPPRVLRELAREVAPILTKIYRSSPQTGEVLRDWREALVTPVFKKGEHYNPANCRPGSITTVPCQLQARLTHHHPLPTAGPAPSPPSPASYWSSKPEPKGGAQKWDV